MRKFSIILALAALIVLIANIYFIIGDLTNGESFSGHVAGAISMLLILIICYMNLRKKKEDK